MGVGTFGGTNDVYALTKFEIPNERVSSLGCGYQHTMVITGMPLFMFMLFCSYLLASGKMYGFGNNEKGQLGILRYDCIFSYPSRFSLFRTGTPTKANPLPVVVASSLLWSSVSAGSEHSLAITRDGKVFSFGSNEYGQLGMITPSF